MLKKTISIILALSLVICMSGCSSGKSSETSGEQSGTESTSMANPMHETDKAGLLNETGLDIDAPEGAETVSYVYIDGSDGEGEGAAAQVEYTKDGVTYCYRAKYTSETPEFNSDIDASPEAITESLNNFVELGAALSGLYSDWDAQGTTLVDDCEGVVALNDGQEGFLAWFDKNNGILYSISVSGDAAQDLLQAAAEEVYNAAAQ